MTQYLVTWTIDIEADTPLEAALQAQTIQRDPESIATIFTISEVDKTVSIDTEDYTDKGPFW